MRRERWTGGKGGAEGRPALGPGQRTRPEQSLAVGTERRGQAESGGRGGHGWGLMGHQLGNGTRGSGVGPGGCGAPEREERVSVEMLSLG